MAKKALIIVTSVEKYQKEERATGLWLAEAVHFYDELFNAGWSIDIASTKGGYIPLDPGSLIEGMDETNWKWYGDAHFRNLLGSSKKACEVNANDYDVVYYAGGHGTVWDFHENPVLHAIGRKVWEKGGIVSSVCHGGVALYNLKLSNGEILIKGKNVTGFSNDEEKTAGMLGHLPYLLEDELIKNGANYTKVAPWGSHVVIDGRLITGQNPGSTRAVGKAVLAHKW